MERKYSISEIDRMRAAVKRLLTPLGVSYSPVEKSAEIEDHLRTYMMNGTDPEELEARANEMWTKQMESIRRTEELRDGRSYR